MAVSMYGPWLPMSLAPRQGPPTAVLEFGSSEQMPLQTLPNRLLFLCQPIYGQPPDRPPEERRWKVKKLSLIPPPRRR